MQLQIDSRAGAKRVADWKNLNFPCVSSLRVFIREEIADLNMPMELVFFSGCFSLGLVHFSKRFIDGTVIS